MRQYVVDAFTDKVFQGNPAAVCVMDKWLPEETMQKIAIENNLSETAFTVKEGEDYRLRWFTPGGEIDLCGHATLGTAYVLLRFYIPEEEAVAFRTRSGRLVVTREGDMLQMEMPAYELRQVPVTDEMEAALGIRPLEAWLGRDLVCVLEDEDQVRSLSPDQEKLRGLDGLLQHVTARGWDYDCVSRSFAPKLSVAEDPVCGSGHCHIAPLWADKLGKDSILAWQASRRGGLLRCRREGMAIKMAGPAALYSQGEIYF